VVRDRVAAVPGGVARLSPNLGPSLGESLPDLQNKGVRDWGGKAEQRQQGLGSWPAFGAPKRGPGRRKKKKQNRPTDRPPQLPKSRGGAPGRRFLPQKQTRGRLVGGGGGGRGGARQKHPSCSCASKRGEKETAGGTHGAGRRQTIADDIPRRAVVQGQSTNLGNILLPKEAGGEVGRSYGHPRSLPSEIVRGHKLARPNGASGFVGGPVAMDKRVGFSRWKSSVNLIRGA